MPVCSLLQRSSMLLNTCFWWKVEYQPLTGICSSLKRTRRGSTHTDQV
ncbi:unnamed protein product [Musa acuminata subsp. malaccensis]|uniref:(wild Malaysian banana) hypothetical protein n=1 Tax=Musa acuminata subsp. malaccensis TaxID=214687 RepID=A0A804HYP3_MUSAM|nr:unnamed protein product [Musa acuminata subsp. malaccensis]